MTSHFKPGERFYELDSLLEAYAQNGFAFSDTPDTPGPGLASYLRIAARNPERAATAVRQIDDLLATGLFSEEIADEVEYLPRVQPPIGMSVEDCLRIARDHIQAVAQHPGQDLWSKPETRWEWRERFPGISELLGAYFNQDHPDEYASHDEALNDYLSATPGDDLDRVMREVPELLSLVQSESELDQVTETLGLEILPPNGATLRQWFDYLGSAIATYRQSHP
ncbi:contact-dependent growth inhibition system immunity protein [Streptomyces sp. NPDC055099]